MGMQEQIKRIERQLSGSVGIASFPAGAAAANDVSLAEVLRYLQENVIRGGTVLPATCSLFDLLAGTNGVPTFPAAAAPANGVSLAEVLRAIYDRQIGNAATCGANTRLGNRVDRATADVITGSAVPIFTVAGGRVLLTSLWGKVTTVIGAGASNAKFQFNPTVGTTVDMCGNLDIDADEAGTLYSIDGTPATAMLRSESGCVRNLANGGGLILDVGQIEFLGGTDRTGSIAFQSWWIPLDDGATLVAA
jgi:hypothetical protein